MSEGLSDRQKRRNRKSLAIKIVSAEAEKQRRVATRTCNDTTLSCVRTFGSIVNDDIELHSDDASDNNSVITSLLKENEAQTISDTTLTLNEDLNEDGTNPQASGSNDSHDQDSG